VSIFSLLTTVTVKDVLHGTESDLTSSGLVCAYERGGVSFGCERRRVDTLDRLNYLFLGKKRVSFHIKVLQCKALTDRGQKET